MASPKNDPSLLDEGAASADELRETPRHGFRGDGPTPTRKTVPASLTIAISREAGSRGNTIGTRAGTKLGWPVYNQELLEYMAQEEAVHRDAPEHLALETAHWVAEHLEQLLRQQTISRHPSVLGLARVVLALASEGAVILIGRGAGLLLPRASTLHVRIIAPLSDRVAYMSQWLRLTEADAAEHVRSRDANRAGFIKTHFYRQPTDIYQYDLLVNSSYLGEDQCVELIVQAARAKQAGRVPVAQG